jgi:hypothetical protein
MSRYHCDRCEKDVEYRSRGFLYFLFWPWSRLMMKKRCVMCDFLVVNHHCDRCGKDVEYKNRGFLYFLFWPWSRLMMKKRCVTCDSETRES